MPDTATLIAFALLALGLVLTPGPNMMYVVSRSICQGRRAGLISLGGVGAGFLFYVVATALGLTGLLLTVPIAYDVLRVAGAAYLLYLAWQTLKPGGRAAFEVRALPIDSNRRLFTMGLFTNLLNPKAAMLYLSLLPQFIQPARGSVLAQSLLLGALQIVISLSVNALIVCAAGSIAALLRRHRSLALAQRALMGAVLGALGLRMLLDARR
jgi:threonine/homoserine/homoserine lactone efflux protein